MAYKAKKFPKSINHCDFFSLKVVDKFTDIVDGLTVR